MFLIDITKQTHPRALYKERHKNCYTALLHQLCSESYHPHFIDEGWGSEGSSLPRDAELGWNLDLSDVEIQLLTITLSCSMF